MITLEQFDAAKFTREKVGFQIDDAVFNVSEGNGDEDGLRYSPLLETSVYLMKFSDNGFGMRLRNIFLSSKLVNLEHYDFHQTTSYL